ncbi:FHA domain-containing protein [Alloscardovia theropitheci]|uniref:FHA domain-containing protein n=1 Tax=Alloscardovia theropitheci TaxID=2496842 RepID=UPI0013F15BA1|nr:FHA domain-containing protein [Alloscardovia theropitheci]
MTDSAVKDVTWVISINGLTKEVHAPAQVYIGRKPLRPVEVPAEAIRFDIPDTTKSMSKNHAKLTINEEGDAILADLNSTNGTYIRNSTDVLLRVPAENPFTIVDGFIDGQFGDVIYEIRLRDESSHNGDDTDETRVPNLFEMQGQQDDVSARSMSVDDILDLRAGEPTSMFALQKPTRAVVEDLQEPAAHEEDIPEKSIPEKAVGEQVEEVSDSSILIVNDEDEKESIDVTQLQETTGDEQAEYEHTDSAVTPQVVINEDSGFMPAYEAGSVFDRLSRGEFDHHDSVVEAGGHTSIEAKTTQDFNIQFEIAQIPQLLPFLSLNPFLYDDMYAWLLAQNNEQINTALESNEGYKTWKASAE